ncbi:transcriptional regulator [Caballeronia sp. dw_19]|uniref:transcriptional regulator n=1 Tax=Caballeronia sp. dw_19 TaxID=2719791 RepID=UPI001BD335DA|nr:transcriptional regulator [Caballeronia sp. dw_19]
MVKSKTLQLNQPIVTGNTKAAVKAAGGGSSDLWTVPPAALHFDPRDNVRPLDPARVRHIADLIKANSYDRKKPLGCIVKKINGEDRIYVYEGQHRYHGALLAISEGFEIDRLPIVIDEAKSVSRVNMIYAGVTNNDAEKLTPLQLAEQVIELQTLGEFNATICRRLNITDQTMRDVLLLAHAPAAIHELVRAKVVSSTLAIDEIRTHGGDKAMFRLTEAAARTKASGKTKITKKVLPKAAAKNITGEQAKQLLQALQAVLHDPLFGKLSPGTIAGVDTALSPLSDLLDDAPKKLKHPVHVANSIGVYDDCEKLHAPRSKRTGQVPASIFIAQPEEGAWVFTFRMDIAPTYGFAHAYPSIEEVSIIHRTRVQAIRAAVSELTRLMNHSDRAKAKEAPIVNAWLDKLYTMPDPDWTDDMVPESTDEEDS